MPEIVYKELSYRINGLLFEVHNKLGRFCREKQYSDALENLLKRDEMFYEREKPLSIPLVLSDFTNKADFAINNQIILEIKAKPLITKEDYQQINRYLEASKYKLGILVNFNRKYLNPIRVIRANS